MDRICINLMDEAPRIGSGWRTVEVISRGRKWVRVKYAPLAIRGKGCRRVSKNREPITIINHRFPTATWAILERYAIENAPTARA